MPDLYAEYYDSEQLAACLDEKPIALHDQTRSPVPPNPSAVERRDHEFACEGTVDLFAMVEPSVGWRYIAVTERRTHRHCAECLRYLVEKRTPTAEYVQFVVDNLTCMSRQRAVLDVPAAAGVGDSRMIEVPYTCPSMGVG